MAPASEDEKKKWAEYLAAQLTGFAGPTREEVGKIGAAADQAGEGAGWLRASIKRKDYDEAASNVSPGPLERVIQFYDFDKNVTKVTGHFEVTLTVPWNEGGNDFSDNGRAGAYDGGYRDALYALTTKHTTEGFTHSFGTVPQIVSADVVDLKSLVTTAKAFDEVQKFFTDYGAELEKWVKDLGGEDAAWQGSAADVFRMLLDGLAYGYKGLKKDLTPTGTPVSLTFGDTYDATSSIGMEIARCAQAIHDAADALMQAWNTWLSATVTIDAATPGEKLTYNTYLPTYHLNAEVNKVAVYLNENNIKKVYTVSGKSTVYLYPGFTIYHPLYGDLTQTPAWQKVAQEAYKHWVETIVATLDKASDTQTQKLNEVFNNLANATGNLSFSTGFTDLKAKFLEESTKKQKEDLEKEKKDLEDEAEKKKDELENKLGGDDGKPPPTLDPNSVGGNLGGDGGLGGKKPPGLDTGTPPPLLNPNGTNGTNGGNVVRTPDGTTIVRNPDGSYTTTYPDGRKETTPPGVTPPLLGLNPPPGLGGTPSKPVPLKTTKGPDGSTTSYNQDGSRTTTHKDGTTTTVARDGTTTTVNPDGSTTVLHKDGSETVTYPDGTRTTIRPDGSSITQYKDGTVQSRAADGTLTTTDAEGNKKVTRPEPGSTVHNPDRSTTTFNKDGSTTTVHPNGTRTTITPQGTVTTIDPDGTKTVSQLGRNTSTIEYADGSVAKVDKDGTVVTTYKDGSSTRLAPDGTYTTTEADGQKKTEHLNPLGGNAGAETTHHADGSTTTRYPDGTVDQKLKDGGHKITFPDGRTVTTDADGRTLSVTGGPSSLDRNNSNRRFGDDYYDYPDEKKKTDNLRNSGYGGYGSGGSGGSSRIPLLSNNPLGHGFGAPGTPSGGGAAGAERLRATATGETTAGRARAAQLAAEEAAALRRPATSSGGMPMVPPMGGGGMGGGQGTQSDERERSTWISEDEDVWGTDEGGVAGVIGR
ncbi:AAWKG family protein [Streptomyces sp. NPDC056503]|uniref:AAWKG family protein n=1 Tax=Streptomyces sp. NPDC056503 TaxID=3345842 RepID=UPI003688CAD4